MLWTAVPLEALELLPAGRLRMKPLAPARHGAVAVLDALALLALALLRTVVLERSVPLDALVPLPLELPVPVVLVPLVLLRFKTPPIFVVRGGPLVPASAGTPARFGIPRR